MTYQVPYDVFVKARSDIKIALFGVCMEGNYEDAAFVPALLSVTAEMSILSQSPDAEIIDQFKKALFDARTRNLKVKQ